MTELLTPVELLISGTKLKTVALWEMILSYVPLETRLLKKEREDFQAYQCRVTDKLIRQRRLVVVNMCIHNSTL